MDPSQDCADLNKSSGGSTTALAGVLKDTVVADFNLEEKQTHLLQKFGDITIDKLRISVLFSLFSNFRKGRLLYIRPVSRSRLHQSSPLVREGFK